MGTKYQRAVYEWVNISVDLVYEWVHFIKGQVYDWGRFRNTGLNTRTTITPKLRPPPRRQRPRSAFASVQSDQDLRFPQ